MRKNCCSVVAVQWEPWVIPVQIVIKISKAQAYILVAYTKKEGRI
jgi:hypothetical protein